MRENEELRENQGQFNVNVLLVSTLAWLLRPGKPATGKTGIQGQLLGIMYLSHLKKDTLCINSACLAKDCAPEEELKR